jgi:hypothetical protein
MIAATLVLPAAGVAYASGNGNVTGNGNVGVLSGNTINAPISVPVNLCGVSLGIIGFANSGCEGGATSNVSTAPSGGGNGGGNGNVTGVGNVGVISGNTVTAPISAPVNVCGVSGAVAGFANSGCRGGAHSNVTVRSGGNGNGGGGNGNVTGVGNVSGVSGNTITAPISAPINLCSISLALLGFSNSGCQGGATSNVTTGTQGSNGNVTGVGNLGLGSGNTITVPISTPVNICGISGAVAGFANSDCKGGSSSCIGQDCNQPSCQGDHCTPCQGQMCQCHGDHCTPCQGQMCHCQGNQCTCHGDHCTPPGCHGNHCTPPGGCHGSSCTPPGGCQANCTPPVTPPHGTHPGTTTVTNATGPVSNGSLPTTGADLLLLGVAAVGTIGVGAGAVTLARRRRSGAAS